MEQIERAGVSGQWVQYNQFTFKNVTSDLKKVEDPEMQKYFEDNCVIFNPTPEERLEHWQPYFSGIVQQSPDGRCESRNGRPGQRRNRAVF